ncbi:triose-phosphate isomerase [Ancylobacter dichloromethanicus]|uniref:Triosephosphate isomerase n=1 Tax=Ancylobacter dichloromethanicus TaxID=518825 RepID=A0A9W6J7N4_9HYPH|nr:triose-phosphate isomerase [Ancylobacter dichloromethanicus]MBS7554225.1 triose-phosphate isomerase [Ancylobacter dichloromethanicus]GLK71346.1 triosephosphate isomerase [Ancylobacter dichloromethanicus]
MKLRRPLVAGNWKMNGLKASVAEFTRIVEGCDGPLAAEVDLMVCPPATLLSAFVAAAAGSDVAIGGQDCHAKPCGAHTGDIAAEMLADAGARAVIVGHSERRCDHGETDAQVRAKAEAARRAGLVAIVCVGETRAEREAGQALDIVRGQLAGSVPDGATGAGLIVAYEPVWAIGTGLTPTNEDIAEVHAALRAALNARFGSEGEAIRLLYGGSVKAENAGEILAVPDVDGALCGGASLKAEAFLAIARSYL